MTPLHIPFDGEVGMLNNDGPLTEYVSGFEKTTHSNRELNHSALR